MFFLNMVRPVYFYDLKIAMWFIIFIVNELLNFGFKFLMGGCRYDFIAGDLLFHNLYFIRIN